MKQNSVNLLTTAFLQMADIWTNPGNPPLYREKSESAESHQTPSLGYTSVTNGNEFIIFCPPGRNFSSNSLDEPNEIDEML